MDLPALEEILHRIPACLTFRRNLICLVLKEAVDFSGESTVDEIPVGLIGLARDQSE